MRYTLLYTYLILYIVCCVIVIRNFVPPKYRIVKLPGQSWQSGYDKVVIPSYDKTCSHVLTKKHVLLFLCLTKKIALNRTYRTLSLQKKAIRLNNQGKTMIAKDSFVPLL